MALLQFDGGTYRRNKIFLHDSIQWCFLADFVHKPLGFLSSPRPSERESQNHSIATLQVALTHPALDFVRLDYPARLRVQGSYSKFHDMAQKRFGDFIFCGYSDFTFCGRLLRKSLNLHISQFHFSGKPTPSVAVRK
jgi:hypothetical protein